MRSPRNTTRYHYKKGNKIFHTGVTKDPARREAEHQKASPGGRLVKQGPKVTEASAKKWERDQAKRGNGTPIKVVPRAQILRERQKVLQEYERRYEMSSEEMAALMEMNATRPTAEAIRWFQVYCAVQSLMEEETPTTGTPGTTTEPSTIVA